MNTTGTIYKWTALLFAVAAWVTVLSRSHDYGAAAFLLALSALFLSLGSPSRKRS